MQRRPRITPAFLLIGLLLFPTVAPILQAQTAPAAQQAAPPPPTPARVGSAPIANCSLPRLAPCADHNRLCQSAGDSRCHQLARPEPEPHRHRSNRRRAKTRLRSSLPRSRHLPDRASNDVGSHRRLRRDRPGHGGQSGRGGCLHPTPPLPGLRLRSAPQQSTAEGRSPAGRQPARLRHSACQSSGRLRAAVQSHRRLRCAQHQHRRRDLSHHLRSRHRHRRPARQQPTLGLGRLGMGLGPRCLLQSRALGRLARRLSPTQHLVPSPTALLCPLSRIRRQLALSPAKLPAALPCKPSNLPTALALPGKPRIPPTSKYPSPGIPSSRKRLPPANHAAGSPPKSRQQTRSAAAEHSASAKHPSRTLDQARAAAQANATAKADTTKPSRTAEQTCTAITAIKSRSSTRSESRSSTRSKSRSSTRPEQTSAAVEAKSRIGVRVRCNFRAAVGHTCPLPITQSAIDCPS